MKTTTLTALCLLSTATLAAVVACGSSTTGSCEETSSCASSSGGTTDGGGDATVAPPDGCDPTADPKDAPKCVSNDFALFVDATNGNDSNAGTRESPMKTINGALGKVGAKPRIYVCEGTYAEHVKLTSAVSLYGGFTCTSWAFSGVKAKVAPIDVGFALELSNVSSAVVVSDIEAAAQGGTVTERSSIAAFVSNSTGVTLRRVKLAAATAANGAPGADAVDGVSDQVSPNGNPGGDVDGGAPKACKCSTGGTTTGGKGGDVSGASVDGTSGAPAQASPSPVSATGDGQTRANCQLASAPAKNGSAAPPAPDAVAPALGALDQTGWHTGDGANGLNGTPGQGGGGGGSYSIGNAGENGGGGGGSCGGCGGGGGGGGLGGGASVALASFNSSVTVNESEFSAGSAGAGGDGKVGKSGTNGGNKPSGGGTNGCPGGAGGAGGKGGAGAGGAGGVSAGVLYKGTKPTLDAATKVTTGAKGSKGTGAGTNNDGPDGQQADTLEAP